MRTAQSSVLLAARSPPGCAATLTTAMCAARSFRDGDSESPPTCQTPSFSSQPPVIRRSPLKHMLQMPSSCALSARELRA